MKKTKRLPYGPVNVELFQEVKRKILEEPRRFDIAEWGQRLEKAETWSYSCGLAQDRPPCGTVACIAGWTSAVHYLKTHKTLRQWSANWHSGDAARLLGLPEKFERKVFYLDEWPKRFQDRYDRATTLEAIAEVAADYIDWICGIKKEEK